MPRHGTIAVVGMSDKGFTLLEAMVTLTLVVVLLGIALPPLNRQLGDSSLSYQAQRLLKHMRFARAQAINHQQTVTSCLADDADRCVQSGPAYFLVFIDSNGNAELNPAETLLARSPPLSPAITATTSRVATRYAADGTSIGTNATLSLCAAGQHRINLVTAQSGRSSRHPPADPCPG